MRAFSLLLARSNVTFCPGKSSIDRRPMVSPMSFPDYCLRYRWWVTDEPTRVRAAHHISLTFTPANYAAPQTATFNGVPDIDAINDRATILPSAHGVAQVAIFIKPDDLDF